MAIKLDEARIRLLKITDTGGNKHISFSRGSYNYIAAPSAGTIGLIANDTLSAAGCAMIIGTSSAYPGTTNTVSLGTSSYKWANVYATTFTGALSGNASTATQLATARSLKISATPGTTGTNFDGSADATLIIPSTVKTFTELGTNKISSSSALYISPASTLYLDSAASTSLIFRPQGTEKARFDTSGNFLIKTAMYPGTNNSYSLGTSSYKWKYIYGITAYTNTYYAGTATAKGNIYLQASGDSSTVATYARFYVNAAGTVGDGTNAVSGSVYLILGNSTASSTTTSAGLNNAYGMLRLYGTGTTYQNLRALNGSNSRTTYLRDHGATAYLVSTTTTSAVGSSTGPVYINSSGVATACGTSLAVSITGNAATATKATQDGSGNTITTTYLKLSGGTMNAGAQILRASSSQSWVNGRKGALLAHAYASANRFTDNQYNPLWSAKSIAGSWDCGTYTTNNSLYFTYITDTNFDAGTNTPSAQIEFRGSDGSIRASKVYGAVWNDYAEYRWVLKHPDTDEPIESGRCVAENGNDSMSLTHDRLQAGARIISDTYGMCMGETEKAKTPIAVCGRVLAYPFERKVAFNVGDPVCSGPNGTVSKMSREEAMMYPERIVGTVVSKPTYKEWGPNKIPVKGRIWIQVR